MNFIFTNLSRQIFSLLKNNNILLLQKCSKPLLKIGFRSQTWVTRIWNAILGYRGFEVPSEEVSSFTKWPKKLRRNFLRFRSLEWPMGGGQCLLTSQLPEMVCALSKYPSSRCAVLGCLRTSQLPEMVCTPSKCPVDSWPAWSIPLVLAILNIV